MAETRLPRRIHNSMWLIPTCLIALCCFAAALRKPRMFGTATVLLVNWGINTAVVQWTGQIYPWPWFLCVDYLSGLVLLIVAGRPTLWQAIVTASFALECIAHGAFGLTKETPWTEYYYWYSLYYIAWSQFWVVTGWGLCDLAGRVHRHARGAASVVPGMERGKPTHPEP